jgi:hypothetical protein
MMNRFFGELIGNWVGKFISVEVDEEGLAWGKELRIRVAVRVDQPLLRGVSIKESEDAVEGTWFDIKYERIPHFCFDCGCLVHPDEVCQAEKEELKQQWGEWLRASPRRNQRPAIPPRPAVSSSSYGSRSYDSEVRERGVATVRDIPPRRSLVSEFSASSSSRTSAHEPRGRGMPVEREGTSPELSHGARAGNQQDGGAKMVYEPKKNQKGTFVRRPRKQQDGIIPANLEQLGTRKRGPKQVWVPVPVQVIGEGCSESAGKRLRTASVFDRLEEQPSADLGKRSNSVFDRIDEQTADPARQGRREQ